MTNYPIDDWEKLKAHSPRWFDETPMRRPYAFALTGDVPPYLHSVPTQGQVEALGVLILNDGISEAHFAPGLSYRLRNGITWAEMHELVELRLCHRVRFGWRISSRLLREWGPYQMYRLMWHRLDHDYWLMMKEAYRGMPDAISVPVGLSAIGDLMHDAVMRSGESLARHWERWLNDELTEDV